MQFVEPSHWLRTAAASQPSLTGTHRSDISVIGAGFTGLSTAIELRRRGYSVSVIEKTQIGNGASGRNCGQVGADIGANLAALIKTLGYEQAQQAANVLRRSITALNERIRNYDLDCDYEATGNAFVGVHSSQGRHVETIARAAQRLGFPIEDFSGGSPTLDRLPDCVVCGFHDQSGGTLDPGRYVKALGSLALSLGVQIYENTPALSLNETGSIRITTPSGVLESDLCVLATNAYTPTLGYLGSRLMPIAVSVIVTTPLEQAKLERLHWENPRGMYTAHHVLENLRLTSDNRLLIGTKYIRPCYGQRFVTNSRSTAFARLKQVLSDRFPELGDVQVESGWTGPVAATTDLIPIVGRIGRRQNIFYAAGYSGHGIAMASHAGEILADLIEDKDLGEASVLMNRRSATFPPEPFRWIGASARFYHMRLEDNRVDALARTKAHTKEVA